MEQWKAGSILGTKKGWKKEYSVRRTLPGHGGDAEISCPKKCNTKKAGVKGARKMYNFWGERTSKQKKGSRKREDD